MLPTKMEATIKNNKTPPNSSYTNAFPTLTLTLRRITIIAITMSIVTNNALCFFIKCDIVLSENLFLLFCVCA